jgi:hypothetical protein
MFTRNPPVCPVRGVYVEVRSDEVEEVLGNSLIEKVIKGKGSAQQLWLQPL